jgi:hypothetical protein
VFVYYIRSKLSSNRTILKEEENKTRTEKKNYGEKTTKSTTIKELYFISYNERKRKKNSKYLLII